MYSRFRRPGCFFPLLSAVLLAAALCFYLLYDPLPDFQNDGVLRVCLDAGHGGDDPGAANTANTRFEKDDCLAMALAVERQLQDSYPEIEVVLTRRSDVYLKLQERCDIANAERADLFLSIHRNSAPGSAGGTEVWISADKPQTDRRLAQTVMDGLSAVGLSDDRGVKSGTADNPASNYYVLANTDMPSCLIELGFISNAEDNRLFDLHLEAYAAAIADAVAELLIEA